MSPAAAQGETIGRQSRANGWFSGARLITLATLLRLLLAVGLFLAACQVAPSSPYTWLSQALKGPDAIAYHEQALTILDFWSAGQENLRAELSRKYLGYPTLLAGAYWLTWPHPLVGVVINALCFLVAGLLARRLALLLGHSPRAADGLALLVALWPPSLTYSAILLKDSLVLMGVFLFLVMAVYAIRGAGGERPAPGKTALRVAGMALGAMVLMNLREDFQPVCLAVGLVAALLGVVGGLLGRFKRGRILASMAVILALLGAVYLNSHYSVARLMMRSAPNLDGKVSSAAPPPPKQAPALVMAAADSGLLASMMPGFLQTPYEAFTRSKLRLIRLRWKYATTGGVSLSPDAQVIPFGSAPRAQIARSGAANLLLFPYPWERWPLGSSFSGLGLVVSLQAVFWYLLIPGLAVGLVLAAWRNFLVFGVLATWFVLVAAVISFVDLNLGTLYRHRDMVILPLLPFLCTGLYAWLGARRGAA